MRNLPPNLDHLDQPGPRKRLTPKDLPGWSRWSRRIRQLSSIPPPYARSLPKYLDHLDHLDRTPGLASAARPRETRLMARYATQRSRSPIHLRNQFDRNLGPVPGSTAGAGTADPGGGGRNLKRRPGDHQGWPHDCAIEKSHCFFPRRKLGGLEMTRSGRKRTPRALRLPRPTRSPDRGPDSKPTKPVTGRRGRPV